MTSFSILSGTRRTAAVLIGAVAMAGSAQAYIVDTGAPSADSVDYLLTNDGASLLQNLGAGFSLSSSYTLTDIDGWIQTNTAGIVTVSLWSGAPSTGSSPLFTTTGSLAASATYGWSSFDSLNWAVGPGTYSVTFSPNVGYDGNMAGYDYDNSTGGAPHPVASYYYLNDSTGWQSQPGLNLGIRVDGVAAPVPEPESYALMLAGLAAMAVVVKRRSR